ncbi:PAS domain S-box protein [Halovenus rubra]|uniref:PAS domain S-box protein n=2 Tax=Halovenus rubra TaxID=869890 RepID=A0ACC7E347_9EURY|nr:PAS domain S-box protein [Halovenus rubra]
MSDDGTVPTHSSDTDDLSRYAYLVEQAEDGLYMLDENGRFSVVNEAFVDLTGYERDEIIGNRVTMVLEDNARKEINATIRSAMRTGEGSGSALTTLLSKSGGEKPVEIRFKLLPFADGYNGLTGVARDIRARQHREQKLDVLSRVLRHNVRNKLNLIFGHAQTLQNTEEDHLQEAAEQIEAAADELIQLSEKARTAQTEVGFNPTVERQMSVVELIEHLAVQHQRKYPDSRIKTDLPQELVADIPKSYRIAISELVENAIEHNPDDEPRVQIRLKRVDSDIITVIEDACPPIPSTDQEAINVGEETPLVHSMGIGLWLANWVADTVGGELELDRLDDDTGNRATLRLHGL